MKKISRSSVLRGAKDAFFKAMLAGYANAKNKTSKLKVIKEKRKLKNGYQKTITVKVGKFTVIDSWRTMLHSDNSFGTTVILFLDKPVWTMSYGGSYPKRVIPFLKEALWYEYKEHNFTGGRGLNYFSNCATIFSKAKNNLIYRNTGTEDFTNFKSDESISYGKKVLGRHKCFGGSLI